MRKTITMVMTLAMGFTTCISPVFSVLAEEEAKRPYEGVELTMLRHSGYDADWMLEKFDELYEDTGIRVNMEQISFAEIHDKIVIDISGAGGTYDLFCTTDYWLGDFCEGDWLYNLSDLMDSVSTDVTDFSKEDIPQVFYDINEINGNIYAIPYKVNSMLTFYRKDLMDSAPATWEDFLEAVKSYQDCYGIGLSLNQSDAADTFLCLLYSAGGSLLNEDQTECTLDSPEALKALEYLIELNQYAAGGATSRHWDETAALFGQGSIAMDISSSSQNAALIDEEKSVVYDQIGYAPLPSANGDPASAVITTWGFSISKNCQNPEAALVAIEYLLSSENCQDLVDQTQGSNISIRSSVLNNEENKEKYPMFGEMLDITANGFSYPKISNVTVTMQDLGAEIQNALNGDKTPEEALRDAKERIEREL